MTLYFLPTKNEDEQSNNADEFMPVVTKHPYIV